MTNLTRCLEGFKGKKSNIIFEVITIIAIIIVVGIVSMTVYKVFKPVTDKLQQSDQMPQESKDIMSSNMKAYPSVFDNGIVFIMVILAIGSIAFAFMIDTNPLFFTITILLFVVILFATVLIANASSSVVDGLGVASSFPKTVWIYHHLLQIVIVIGFLIGGALYAKSSSNNI